VSTKIVVKSRHPPSGKVPATLDPEMRAASVKTEQVRRHNVPNSPAEPPRLEVCDGHASAARTPVQLREHDFLNELRKARTVVRIYMRSGIALNGQIFSFDQYTIVLREGENPQMLYKRAISTIVAEPMSTSNASKDASIDERAPRPHQSTAPRRLPQTRNAQKGRQD
jgi:host factor-I protein